MNDPQPTSLIGTRATFNYLGRNNGSKDAAHAGQAGTIVTTETDAETGEFYELRFDDGYTTWTYPQEVTLIPAEPDGQ